jgi:protein-tyrosine-phosphatase/tRNA A37 threonylcarbamoyladenosine synthetase subunit TsaC/SUA5/YrdC
MTFETSETSETPADPRAPALAALLDGRRAAVPTESVYALASAVESPQDLAATLADPARHGAAYAFPDPAAALAALPAVTLPARRLAARYLPGPLVLRAETAAGEAFAVRVPAHDDGRAIAQAIHAVGRRLALADAWPMGGSPCLDAAMVAAADASWSLAAIVDGGRAALGEPPAIVRADAERFEVVRAGILSVADLERVALRRVLFVCAGNTCRSPMAAALLRQALASRLGVAPSALRAAGYVVDSAGAHAARGAPASRGAVRALEARGIDLSSHRSQPLMLGATAAAPDRVYAMTRVLVDELRFLAANGWPLPTAGIRHVDAHQRDVADPFGGSDAEYVATANEIAPRVARIAEELIRDFDDS